MLSHKKFSLYQLLCISFIFVFVSMIDAANGAETITGKVTDVVYSAGFTYAEVDIGKQKIWAAGAGTTSINKGDVIAFASEMSINNFHSKSLDRTFEIIYFVKIFETDSEKPITKTPHSLSNVEIKTGGYLREAKLDGLNTTSKNLSNFKGKPLIINVWASWCGPCRAEMASLQNLANLYNGKAFNIIGISTDDYRNKAEGFILSAELTFDNFIDNKLQLEKMLGANTIPLTLLVDEQGKIVAKVRGAREWDSPEMIKSMAKAFNVNLTN